MAGSITYGSAGKKGKIVLNTTTLRLTKWSMPTEVGKAELTNSESLQQTINGVSLIAGEYTPTIFDAHLSFEGVYTLTNDGAVVTGLMSGTGNIMPGFGTLPSSTGQNGFAVTLTPDRGSASDTITGNVIIEHFEITGELKGIVSFKGDGIFTGGITPTNT